MLDLCSSQLALPLLLTAEATVNFTQLSYAAEENSLSATVCASIDGNLDRDVVVFISTMDNTAQGVCVCEYVSME